MLFLRLYEGKQEYTDTRVGLEGYLVLSTAKRHNVQEGSSGEVAPAMRVVLHLWHHGGLLPNTRDKTTSFCWWASLLCLHCCAPCQQAHAILSYTVGTESAGLCDFHSLNLWFKVHLRDNAPHCSIYGYAGSLERGGVSVLRLFGLGGRTGRGRDVSSGVMCAAPSRIQAGGLNATCWRGAGPSNLVKKTTPILGTKCGLLFVFVCMLGGSKSGPKTGPRFMHSRCPVGHNLLDAGLAFLDDMQFVCYELAEPWSMHSCWDRTRASLVQQARW